MADAIASLLQDTLRSKDVRSGEALIDYLIILMQRERCGVRVKHKANQDQLSISLPKIVSSMPENPKPIEVTYTPKNIRGSTPSQTGDLDTSAEESKVPIGKCFNSTFSSKKFTFECEVCFGEFEFHLGVVLDCKHRFCLDDFRDFVENLIKSNKVLDEDLKCLKADCVVPIGYYRLREYISHTLFTQYEDLRAKTITSTADDEIYL